MDHNATMVRSKQLRNLQVTHTKIALLTEVPSRNCSTLMLCNKNEKLCLLEEFCNVFNFSNSSYLNTTSCGTLQVSTAHERKYIKIPNLIKFRIAKPGEKNIPIHT